MLKKPNTSEETAPDHSAKSCILWQTLARFSFVLSVSGHYDILHDSFPSKNVSVLGNTQPTGAAFDYADWERHCQPDRHILHVVPNEIVESGAKPGIDDMLAL